MADETVKITGDHAFNPQTLGSAYCKDCGARFDTSEHGYAPSLVWQSPADMGSVAADILENIERDVADERQYRREEFSDEWPL